ncbi:hypothetical protein Ah1_00202 [Aeromonas phage Ah1]|uniref:Uncharacterized protein n=1 Tax=Aeromonas phage Ah1 TaxID=2053701 RepID=A0A2H4YEX4_9CAUD|nr:hypothetical protein KNT77_gp316 [Aeromonas phage Ah1]AUE22720.1 hypothetical protein Ah1_00202 [Aeromonas phage Ah1]
MKETNEILEDSSLKLAVQLDDTRKQARDLETAFDMTTDSSLDVAKAEDSLVKSISSKVKATERATEYMDTVAYAQRNSSQIEDEYQKALQRRTELENKISSQSPIIRYSEQAANAAAQTDIPAGDAPSPSPTPETKPDVDAELKKFLKEKGLTSRKEYEDKKKADKQEREENKGFIRKSAESLVKNTLSTIHETASGAFSQMVSGVESAVFKDIPGYGMARSAVNTVASKGSKFIKDVGSRGIEKLKENRFERLREKEISKFQSSREVETGEDVNAEEQSKKESQEQRQERGENRKERGENDKRHKTLISTLKDLGKMLLIGGIMKMFGGLLGGLASLGTGLFSRFGLLITTLGGLAAKFASAIKSSLGSMFEKAFPGFKKPKPDIDVDGKKHRPDVDADGKKPKPDVDSKGKPRPNVDVDINGKPKPTIEPGKTPDVEMKSGKALGEAAETIEGKAGQKAAAAGTKGFLEKIGGKAALTGAAKVVGRVATKFIPFVGTALLLSDLYDIADYVTDGKVSDMVNSAGDALKEKLSPVANIQSGMAPESAAVEASGENLKRAEAEKKERDRQRDATAMRAQMAMTSNVNNNNTSIYTSSFGFPSDHGYSNSTPYGMQNR